mgnify:CR=1 FL=1|tara:strand:+ start:1501 stop:1761 length:261 start_codon:yes stop_codon:yes gene_type:complete
MARQRFSGPKYANGNHKSQQKAYNRTKHGTEIRVRANAKDRETKRNGTGKKGDGKDNAHYPGSKTRSRLMIASRNRGTERRKPRSA